MSKDIDKYNQIKVIQEATKETFLSWCNEGYDMLQNGHLKLAKETLGDNEVNLAIRRMLGTFIDLEEFEKCIYLRDLLEKEFQRNIEPVFDYREL